MDQLINRIAYSRQFELLVVFVIIFSALTIGAKTFDQLTKYDIILYWVDWLVTAFFLVEIIVRFRAAKSFKEFVKNPWNIFDTVIITLSLIPLEQTNLVLLARLLRIFRVLRLVSVMPELRQLISTMVIIVPRVSYIVLLMFIVFYIYGALGSFMFSEINEKQWGNIAVAVLTLFQVVTFDGWVGDVFMPIYEVHPFSWIYFVSFIIINVYMFLNMAIATVVSAFSEEHDQQIEDDHNKRMDELEAKLDIIINKLDKP